VSAPIWGRPCRLVLNMRHAANAITDSLTKQAHARHENPCSQLQSPPAKQTAIAYNIQCALFALLQLHCGLPVEKLCCMPPLKQARSGNQGGWEDRSGSSPMMKLDVGSSPAKVPCSRGPPDLPCSLFSSALGGSSCGRSCLLLAPPIELLYNPLLPFSCPVVVKVHYCRGQSRGRWLAKHGVFIVGPKIWVDPKLSVGSHLGPPMPPTIQLCVIVSVPQCSFLLFHSSPTMS